MYGAAINFVSNLGMSEWLEVISPPSRRSRQVHVGVEHVMQAGCAHACTVHLGYDDVYRSSELVPNAWRLSAQFRASCELRQDGMVPSKAEFTRSRIQILRFL